MWGPDSQLPEWSHLEQNWLLGGIGMRVNLKPFPNIFRKIFGFFPNKIQQHVAVGPPSAQRQPTAECYQYLHSHRLLLLYTLSCASSVVHFGRSGSTMQEYSLGTIRKPRSPWILKGERALLRVNRL